MAKLKFGKPVVQRARKSIKLTFPMYIKKAVRMLRGGTSLVPRMSDEQRAKIAAQNARAQTEGGRG